MNNFFLNKTKYILLRASFFNKKKQKKMNSKKKQSSSKNLVSLLFNLIGADEKQDENTLSIDMIEELSKNSSLREILNLAITNRKIYERIKPIILEKAYIDLERTYDEYLKQGVKPSEFKKISFGENVNIKVSMIQNVKIRPSRRSEQVLKFFEGALNNFTSLKRIRRNAEFKNEELYFTTFWSVISKTKIEELYITTFNTESFSDLPTSLKNLEVEFVSNDLIDTNIFSLPPNLDQLKSVKLYSEKILKSELQIDWTSFPNGITTLEVDLESPFQFVGMNQTKNTKIGELPSSLEVLIVSNSTDIELAFEKFPESLRELYIGKKVTRTFDQYPLSLKKYTNNSKSSVVKVDILPDGLQDLTVSKISESYSSFPKNLINLIIEDETWNGELGRTLGSSIKKISLPSSYNQKFSGIPQGLNELWISSNVLDHPISGLPQSIKKMSIDLTNDKDYLFEFDSLPKGLEDLKIALNPTYSKNIKGLPSSLKYLRIYAPIELFEIPPNVYYLEIEDTMGNEISRVKYPSSIKKLKLSRVTTDVSTVTNFPQNLFELDLYAFSNKKECEFVLPDTLTRFKNILLSTPKLTFKIPRDFSMYTAVSADRYIPELKFYDQSLYERSDLTTITKGITNYFFKPEEVRGLVVELESNDFNTSIPKYIKDSRVRLNPTDPNLWDTFLSNFATFYNSSRSSTIDDELIRIPRSKPNGTNLVIYITDRTGILNTDDIEINEGMLETHRVRLAEFFLKDKSTVPMLTFHFEPAGKTKKFYRLFILCEDVRPKAKEVIFSNKSILDSRDKNIFINSFQDYIKEEDDFSTLGLKMGIIMKTEITLLEKFQKETTNKFGYMIKPAKVFFKVEDDGGVEKTLKFNEFQIPDFKKLSVRIQSFHFRRDLFFYLYDLIPDTVIKRMSEDTYRSIQNLLMILYLLIRSDYIIEDDIQTEIRKNLLFLYVSSAFKIWPVSFGEGAIDAYETYGIYNFLGPIQKAFGLENDNEKFMQVARVYQSRESYWSLDIPRTSDVNDIINQVWENLINKASRPKGSKVPDWLDELRENLP